MFNWAVKPLQSLNSSRFFAGLVMLLLNIGSKYITIDLTAAQKKHLQHRYARQALIFAISWMGSRDILKALALTAIFNVLAGHLLHEGSPYCIIPDRFRQFEKALDVDGDGVVTQKEINNAIKLLEKARKERRKRNHLRMVGGFDGIY